jgi:hypothetical protein
MGNNEDPTERSPRGIRGFKLNNGTFSTWTVQGKKGGYTKYVYVEGFRSYKSS